MNWYKESKKQWIDVIEAVAAADGDAAAGAVEVAAELPQEGGGSDE